MRILCLFASFLPLFGYSIAGAEQVGSAPKKALYLPINDSYESNEKYGKETSALLNVPIINQNPELKYGCEVTSLAMVLQYAGVHTNKMELYQAIQKESDPIIRNANGDILYWGNPEHGFVGDMTGRSAGTTVFEKPVISLINQKLPGRAVNLTNQPFEHVLHHVAKGYPVVVWTTLDYGIPKRWETWRHGKQIVRVPLDLHAVVLVGFDTNYVYLNDPLTVKKQVMVSRSQFISSWMALGSRAVSYSITKTE